MVAQREPYPLTFIEDSQNERCLQQVDPRLGRNPFLLRLTQIESYLSVIRRAPLDRWARLRCYRAVARWLGDRITARLLDAVHHLGPASASSGPIQNSV
jgi:hypothetical protein